MIRVWYFCYARDYNDAQTREYKILVLVILRDLFPLTSLVNLAAISLERLHATFFHSNIVLLRNGCMEL